MRDVLVPADQNSLGFGEELFYSTETPVEGRLKEEDLMGLVAGEGGWMGWRAGGGWLGMDGAMEIRDAPGR